MVLGRLKTLLPQLNGLLNPRATIDEQPLFLLHDPDRPGLPRILSQAEGRRSGSRSGNRRGLAEGELLRCPALERRDSTNIRHESHHGGGTYLLPDMPISQRKESVREQEDASTIPFDPLKKYLSEISRHSVLSREEELEVAEKAHRYKDSDASQRLVTSNLRLVVKIALEYYNTYLNILDLIQEGNMGLVHAVKKYNPYKGTRFSTYSSFWIRAYILKYIMDSWSIVKLGTTQGQRRLFYRLKKEKKKLEAIGIFPAPQLLAEIIEVKVAEVEDMEKRLSLHDISLDHPVYDEGEETLLDMIKTDDNIEDVVAARKKRRSSKER